MARTLRDRRREILNEARRGDVLRAASGLFAAKGYDGAQIAEIASVAEVSLSSVYSIFEGKEQIYQAVIQGATDSIGEAIVGRVSAVEDPAERLLTLVDVALECFDGNRDLMRIYTRTTSGLPWRMRRAMGDSSALGYVRFVEWVAEFASQAQKAGYLPGLDPEMFATTLVGAITTTAARCMERTPDAPLTDSAPALKAVCRRLLHGEEPDPAGGASRPR